jgi:hypothetical protein
MAPNFSLDVPPGGAAHNLSMVTSFVLRRIRSHRAGRRTPALALKSKSGGAGLWTARSQPVKRRGCAGAQAAAGEAPDVA